MLERPPLTPLPQQDDLRDTQPATPDTTDGSDVYRGEPSPPHSPYPESTSSTSSSSSSSSWSFFIGRNIVSTLEQAINKWRGNPSSASSSSSSSKSSIATLSRSQLSRRRRRRGSISSNLKSQQSERDFSARISLIKAREESRIIPRQFSLYLAPSLRPDTIPHPPGELDSPYSQGVLWTSSLPSVLDQLNAALKRTARTRRNREKDPPAPSTSTSQRAPDVFAEPHLHPMLPESLKAPSRAASFTDLAALRKTKKGKAKEGSEAADDVSKPMQASNLHNWYLDVASPTSEDMRAIGKLLHLHPLTLEDILQQDPREKLELFPRLGYYFISFRAIESRTIRAKLARQLDHNVDTSEDEGLLAESNVYLVVFNEGVCSFHFMDASEHTDRVRNRIISLEKSINMSSAWIAHSLMDSIVDSFFPFAGEIEKEVMSIEQIVYSGGLTLETQVSKGADTAVTRREESSESTLEPEKEKEPLPQLNEKNLSKLGRDFSVPIRTHFALPRPPLPLLYRRVLRYIRTRWRSSPQPEKSAPSATTTTLRRMARTRKLVTSLTRLLAVKSEVVAQVKKRLLTGLGNGNTRSDEIEVAMYMGDVQDHILTLQHSLAHYERMLSQSHPTYLQQLRTHVSLTKSGADKSLVFLTTVSIAVLCLQTLIGSFSLNVTVPRTDNSFHVFGIILSLAVLVLMIFLGVVRRWWIKAKIGRGTVLR